MPLMFNISAPNIRDFFCSQIDIGGKWDSLQQQIFLPLESKVHRAGTGTL